MERRSSHAVADSSQNDHSKAGILLILRRAVVDHWRNQKAAISSGCKVLFEQFAAVDQLDLERFPMVPSFVHKNLDRALVEHLEDTAICQLDLLRNSKNMLT
jgi:hypothetical protein